MANSGWPYFLIQDLYRRGMIQRGHSWLVWCLASLRPAHRRIEIEIPNVGPLLVDLSDRGQCGYFLNVSHPTERVELELAMAAAPRFEVIFDIGAHIGLFSRLFARWASPDTAIHAFEPSERTFRMLAANLQAYPNVKLNPLAVSDTHGLQRFFVHACSDLSSLLRRSGKSVMVKTTTLDQYCEEHSISKVDMIKCDVEGGELEVVLGARALLGSKSPPIWLIENSDKLKTREAPVQKKIAEAFRNYSSKPLSYFYSQADGNRIQLFDCDPELVSWSEAGNNIWVVPESWKQTFLSLRS